MGKKGASGRRVQGTAALPVTMEPWSANDPSAWAGVAIYDAVIDAEVALEHLVVGYAGGPVVSEVTYSGNGSGECSGCP